MTLKQIEKRMGELQKEIYGGVEKKIFERNKRMGVTQEIANRQIEAAKKPLIQEFEILKLKRQHILDKKGRSWLPKIIWNFIIKLLFG
ncbi:hypothetical protein KJ885_05190 [Patescibacteria group bacterium]|nr:hypothetical protein [Patescibacteria group bacterium]